MAGLRPGAWTRHRPRLALAHARLAGVTTDVAIEPMWAIEMYASRLPLGDVQQVLAVVVLAQRLGEAAELVGGDEALAPGDLLQAGDLQALAMLAGLHELRGVDEAVVGAGVQPGKAPPGALHLQLPGLRRAAVGSGNEWKGV